MSCSIEGCDRPIHARGWCGGHYHRWFMLGDPGGPLRAYRRPAEERFWEKVERGANDECWTWTAATTGATGYGRFYATAGGVVAHRFAYEMLVGPVPAGLVLDHLCRNRLCVNPAHLEPVTNRENVLRGVGPTAQNAAKDECTRGHELAEAPDGRRFCPVCARATKRRWQEKATQDATYRARRRERERRRYQERMKDPAYRARMQEKSRTGYHRRKDTADGG